MSIPSPASSDGRLGYRPALDGIRAVAIAAVVAYHAFGWPAGGGLGVDLFFVLSGFLITTLLLEERQARGRIAVSLFYARRALRLFPALAVMLAAYLALSAVIGNGLEQNEAASAAYGITYTSNLALAFGGFGEVDFPLWPLWSLAVEEQYYLVWPLVLVLVCRRAVRPLALAGGAVAAALAIVVARFLLEPAFVPTGGLDAAVVLRFDSVLVGSALGAVAASPVARRRLGLLARPSLLAPAFAVCAWLLVRPGGDHWVYDGATFAFSVAAAALVAIAAGHGAGRTADAVRGLLSAGPLVFLGKISYALYLWHVMVLAGFRDSAAAARLGESGAELLAIAVSIGVAYASMLLVERPFLRWKRRLAGRASSSRDGASAPAALPAEGAAPTRIVSIRRV